MTVGKNEDKGDRIMNQAIKGSAHVLRAFFKWIFLGVAVGAVCGTVGVLFHKSITLATFWRGELPWLLYLLPVGGLVIVLFYKLLGQPVSLGTDQLFLSIQDRTRVPIAMAPLIFVSTFLTHLLGGSAGREGAALQLGGSIANGIGARLHLSEEDRRIITMAGMGALFAGLFGTPLTSVFFVMEVLAMGHMVYAAVVPCTAASLTAYGVSLLLHVSPEFYAVKVIPSFSAVSALQAAGLGVLCAGVSIVFCVVMHAAHEKAAAWIKNPYFRIAAGGAVIVLLTVLLGTTDYNGAGGHVIERAITEGNANPWDFALKLLFTAVTLGCGFKGGEIVPSFYVGATFGCVVGPLFGMDPGFAAAIGLAAVFCGNTNCPIAAVFLAIELFGGKAVPLFMIACAVSYMLSGNYSLYHAQMIPYKDLKLGVGVLPENGGSSEHKGDK